MNAPVAASGRGAIAWAWLSLAVILLDQATKDLARRLLAEYEQVAVLPVFNFTLAYNRGAAFSMLADAGGWQRWLFAALAVAAAVFIIRWLRELPADRRWLPCALALVLGGALGNLIDRLVLGHVTDFIQLHWQARWYFPAFNVADSAISVGAVMLAIDVLRDPGR
ncbi:MAG: signal peptidase II [Gammaproteobacteria bacterium]